MGRRPLQNPHAHLSSSPKTPCLILDFTRPICGRSGASCIAARMKSTIPSAPKTRNSHSANAELTPLRRSMASGRLVWLPCPASWLVTHLCASRPFELGDFAASCHHQAMRWLLIAFLHGFAYLQLGAGENSTVELIPQLGHWGSVIAADWSPDGELIATGGGRLPTHGRIHDNFVKLWRVTDPNKPLLLATLSGHRGSINALKFNNDGSILASASSDKTVRLWDTRSGRLLGVLTNHQDRVTALAFDGENRLHTGGMDRQIHVYQINGSQIERRNTLSVTNPVTALVFCGSKLLAGDDVGGVTMWFDDRVTRTKAAGKPISCLAADSTSGLVAVCTGDDHIRVLDVNRALDVKPWKPESSHLDQRGILAAAFGGSSLYTAGWDHTIGIRETKGFNLTRPLIPAHNDAVTSLALSPNCALLLSVSQDYSMSARIWDVKRGIPLAVLPATPVREGIEGLSLACHSNQLAMAGGHDNVIRRWDLKSGFMLPELGQNKGHGDNILCLAYSPDGSILASGAQDRFVKLWEFDGNVNTNVVTLAVGEWPISLAWSPDGKMLAAGAAAGWGDPSGKVLVWDLSQPTPRTDDKGRRLADYQTQDLRGRPRSLAFSVGALFAGCSDQVIRRWTLVGHNLHQMEEFPREHKDQVEALIVSRDGSTLVSGGKSELAIWDVQSKKLVVPLNSSAHSDLIRLVCSPDSTTFYSGSWDGTIKNWNLKGQFLEELALSNRVDALAFDNSGHLIVSTSDDYRSDLSVLMFNASQLAGLPLLKLNLLPGNQWLAYQPATHNFVSSADAAFSYGADLFAFRFNGVPRATWRLSDWYSDRKRNALPIDSLDVATTVLKPPSRWAIVKRNPHFADSVAYGGLAILGAFGVFFWYSVKQRQVKFEQQRAQFERARAEAARSTADRQAEQRDRERLFFGAFIRSLEHRVRTARALSESLGIPPETTPIAEAFRKLEGLACRLFPLSEEGADISSAPKWVSVHDFVRDVGRPHASQCKTKGIVWHSNIRIADHEAYLDDTIAGETLDNILSNAVKFTATGSVCVSIDFSAANDGRLEFTVRDTGIGISADDRLRLPSMYERGSNVKNIPGSGMGLAIVQNLVRILGGSFNLSQHAQGTIAFVSLPAKIRPDMAWQEAAVVGAKLPHQDRTGILTRLDHADWSLQEWTPPASFEPLGLYVRKLAKSADWDRIRELLTGLRPRYVCALCNDEKSSLA